MSQPELLDRIRSARITASPELRARVRAITVASPPRREVPWRRWTLVLVPACLAVALVGALAVGLATSGKQRTQQARGGAGSTTGGSRSEAQRDTATPAARSEERRVGKECR